MQSAIVVDLQPLNCMGMQAFLQGLFPEIKCLTASSEHALDALAPDAAPGLVILGTNQESGPLLDHLKEKAMAMAGKAPVIICYQHFSLGLIRNFRHLAGIGLICKDHIQQELAECIQRVTQGQTYLCEDTGQYLIGEFIKLPKPKRHRKVQKAAPNTGQVFI